MTKLLIVATAFLTLFAAQSFAADPGVQFPPGFFSNTPPRTIEQRFQEADMSLAIAQYEKLQMASFELRLKLQLDPPAKDEERAELAKRAEILRAEAAALRDETIRRGATAAAPQR
jgi:hypothetical protein